jgi:hypothetical protein
MSQDGRRGGAHIYRPQRPSNRPPCCTGPPATQCYYDVVRQLFGRAQRLGRRERARGRPALGAGCLAWPRGWWVRRGGVAGRGACARGVRRMLLLRCPLALRGASHPDPCRPRLPPLPAPCIRRQGRGRTAGRWRWSPAHRPRHPARTGPPAAAASSGRGGVLGPQAARPFARRQGANYNASVKSVSAQKLRCSIRLLVVRSQKKIFIAPLMQITGTFREPDQGRQSARLTLYIRDREAKLLMRSRLACTQRTDQWWSHDTSIIEIVPHHCGRSTLIAGPGSSQ